MMNEFVENVIDDVSIISICYFVYVDYVDENGEKYLDENIEDVGIEMDYDLRNFEEAKKFARDCVENWDKIGCGILHEIKVVEDVYDGQENVTREIWNMIKIVR